MKTISAALTTALDAAHVQSILFVQADFDSGTQRYCTAGATVAWNGQNWLGTGGLISIDPIKESTSVESVGLRVTMSGVPSSMVSLALSETIQGRAITIWVDAMDASGVPIASPPQIYAGRMDTMVIDESADTATITVTIESEMAALMKAAVRRYTDADQQKAYPGDLIFNYIPQMVEKVLPFPSKEAQR